MGEWDEIECDCAECRQMCASSTCMPTPEEAKCLMRAGLAGRLASYRWRYPSGREIRSVGPAPAGLEGARDLVSTRIGACTFHQRGLCELHGLGLKPSEGRLAHHTRPFRPIRVLVESKWSNKQFQSVLRHMDRRVEV
jgi:hypothetical protein